MLGVSQNQCDGFDTEGQAGLCGSTVQEEPKQAATEPTEGSPLFRMTVDVELVD